MTPPAPARVRGGWLPTLFLGGFVLGCTEFVVVGLLPQIAANLHVQAAAAGQLVAAFAVAFAVAAPVLGSMTASLSRRLVLVSSLVFFALTVAGSAAARNLVILLLLRLGTGAAAGLFTTTAVATAARLARPERQGSAMAVVAAGSGTATALGVPIGTALGQAVGWRVPFLVIAALSLGVAAMLAVAIPPLTGDRSPGGARTIRTLLTPRLVTGYGAVLACWAAYVSLFTYVVPLLSERGGVLERRITIVLFITGVMAIGGNLAGGRGADLWLRPTLFATAVAVVTCVVILSETLGIAFVVTVALWQFFNWAFAPAFSLSILRAAGSAAQLAVGVTIAIFNVGIVLGAIIGGVELEIGGLDTVLRGGLGLALLGLVLVFAFSRQPDTERSKG